MPRKAFEIAQMLVGVDHGNVQAQSDLASAYTDVGDSFRLTNHEVAGTWYQKSINLTKRLIPHYGAGARHWLAIRDEALAETLDGQENAPEDPAAIAWKPIRSGGNLQKTSPTRASPPDAIVLQTE